LSRTIAHIKDKRSKEKKQEDFLNLFSELASVARACKKAKVPRRNIYDWIDADPNFKVKFEIARKQALSILEDEAVRRAIEGVGRPVFQQGKKVGVIKEYSDTLLIVLLKANGPEKYKERFASEVTHHNPLAQKSEEELKQLLKQTISKLE
jgi:hypothetical protein